MRPPLSRLPLEREDEPLEVDFEPPESLRGVLDRVDSREPLLRLPVSRETLRSRPAVERSLAGA